jgi:hypothetical protein
LRGSLLHCVSPKVSALAGHLTVVAELLLALDSFDAAPRAGAHAHVSFVAIVGRIEVDRRLRNRLATTFSPKTHLGIPITSD